jgi:hypothetical protein
MDGSAAGTGGPYDISDVGSMGDLGMSDIGTTPYGSPPPISNPAINPPPYAPQADPYIFGSEASDFSEVATASAPHIITFRGCLVLDQQHPIATAS